jgi:regulator of sirC expression with transglutaminase-like and TPR domain
MKSIKVAAEHDTQAQSYYERGEYDRAIIDATRAVELQPATAAYYRTRGQIFTAMGLLSAARQDFQRGAALGDTEAKKKLWTL